MQLGTFLIFTFFQQEVSLFYKNKKNKLKQKQKQKEELKQNLNLFLGGGRKGVGGGCFISLSLVGNKNVENKIILFTGWEGIIKKM